MMTCRQLAELLLDFISGELHADHAAEINEHLHGCSSCVAFVHSYRVTITMTQQLPPVPLRSEFAQRLEKLLQDQQKSAG
jgi:anti-sigma factor RsiW